MTTEQLLHDRAARARAASARERRSVAWLVLPIVLLILSGVGLARVTQGNPGVDSEEIRIRLARIAESTLLSDRGRVLTDPLLIIEDLGAAGYSLAYDSDCDAYVSQPMQLQTSEAGFSPTYTLQVQYLSGGLNGRTVEFFEGSTDRKKHFDTIRVVCSVAHAGQPTVRATRYVMFDTSARTD